MKPRPKPAARSNVPGMQPSPQSATPADAAREAARGVGVDLHPCTAEVIAAAVLGHYTQTRQVRNVIPSAVYDAMVDDPPALAFQMATLHHRLAEDLRVEGLLPIELPTESCRRSMPESFVGLLCHVEITLTVRARPDESLVPIPGFEPELSPS